MSDEKIYEFDGDNAKVTWDERLCIHVAECGRAKNDLFVGGRKPWCRPDEVDGEIVGEVVERCPSGALAYTRHDGGAEEQPTDRNTIVVTNNGPLYLRGALEIDGAADDMPGVRFRAALCRCGESKIKPFCDNTHEEIEFRDRGAVGESGDALEERGGTLTVKRIKDGPLIVEGNVELLAATGRNAWSGTRAALCRCGASENKPFCDGSHRKVGFEADGS